MSDYNEYYKKSWEMNLAKQTEQIATLEAKLAKAREALEHMVVIDPVQYDGELAWSFKMIARKALKEISPVRDDSGENRY